ncbi:MAG: sulfatase-like hydrolase/transferase [Bacteroidota bacterium]|nr:sulfatase-like hydrolase/transferase [Bacteroidota bacterium]
MKKTYFPRIIKWMFFTAIIFLVFMTIMRFVFFLHFRPAQYTFSNSLNAFLLGLNFDTRIVCGIVLFPFLVGNLHLVYKKKQRLSVGSIFELIITILIMFLLMLFIKKGHASIGIMTFVGVLFALILVWLFGTKNCNPFENKVSKKIFKIYFFIITISLVFLYAVDFEHFDYLHQRLDASVLNYTQDAKISMSMVWETYPVFTLIFLIIIGTSIFYWLINWYFKKVDPAIYRGHIVIKILFGFLFAIILGIGVFGRINQYPLRWSDAFALNDDFKANLSLNPVQSFLSTLEFRNSTFDPEKVKEYYPLMAKYLNIDHPDSTHLNYKRAHEAIAPANPPNVVIVICESFSAYKSSMWGNPLNTTPYFNQMCKDGIFFDRCFTPAYGTARGVWAVITGIPDVEYPNTSSRNPAYVDQHSIINDYKGYDKYYFIGGSSSWANVRGLLTNNLKGLHLYEEEDYKSKIVDVWGISDKRLFMEANKVLKEQKKPFFAVIQTSDNHRPYTIPTEDKKEFSLENYPVDSLKKYGFYSNEELNAFRYTDFSFQKFIETAKKEAYFNNTIFVFVGDHGIRGDAGDMFPKAWEIDGLTTEHVPLLFYSPALLSPQRFGKTCSQLDILPSVSALAHISYVNTTLGKNLFDTVQNNVRFKNAAFLFDPNIKQIGIATDEYCYVHNLLSGKEDFRSAKNNLPLPQTAQVETDKKELQQLSQAYYETARYMLLNNKKGTLGNK